MRFYRVHKYEIIDGSSGSDWFTTKSEATKAANQWHRENGDETGGRVDVDIVEIEPTKAGILRALNLYASHPDNG